MRTLAVGARRGEHLFAPGALALADELEGQGVTVAYAGDPQYVLILESREWWGPAIRIAQDAVAAFNPTERTIGQTIIRVRP